MNISLRINLNFRINFSPVDFRFSTPFISIKYMIESITLAGLFFYYVLMLIVWLILIPISLS